MNQSFRVNSPKVAAETIDGEVVVVNLDSGHYYSLLSTGAYIWNCLENGRDLHDTVKQVIQTYDGKSDQIATSVNEFLDKLVSEELIVAIDSPTNDAQAVNVISGELVDKPRFEQPVLEKFTDMEDLLLLDPIHEVDLQSGWPNQK
jgi:outer membrane protein assembly factor BamB